MSNKKVIHCQFSSSHNPMSQNRNTNWLHLLLSLYVYSDLCHINTSRRIKINKVWYQLPWSEKPLCRKTSVHVRLQMGSKNNIYDLLQHIRCERKRADCPWRGDKAMKPFSSRSYVPLPVQSHYSDDPLIFMA